ncbi:MAG: glycosyltransferase [Muribaculaceae bacterium]
MRHILVYAYQLHPFKGSECGLAWDYVINMSKTNRLTVLYGTCEGYHDIGSTSFLEKWIVENPVENVTLVPVKPSFEFTIQGYGLKGIFNFYRQYARYQEDVLMVAKRIFEKEKIDLVHYLGPIGYHEPGLLWTLPCPYMWGPLGGVVSYDTRLLWSGSLDKRKWFFARVKRFVNDVKLRFNKKVKTALENSDLVLGCTNETVGRLRNVFHLPDTKLQYFPQNCIKELHPVNNDKFLSEVIEIVWIGRLDNFKSLITVLKALQRTRQKSRFRLNVVGNGVLEYELKQYVTENGLSETVRFYGNLPREKVWEIINKSHLHVITSMHDVNPTVFWEAMSYCVPTLSLTNCGLEDIITDEIGFLIPITSYDKILNNISSVLDSMSIEIL